MRIIIICSVRKATEKYRENLEKYVRDLEKKGNEVFLPHRDNNQDAKGFDICWNMREAINWADRVDIFYSPDSQGTHFDMGMAFMANKEIKIIENVKYVEGKSYARMLKEWETDQDRPLFAQCQFP